MGLRGSDVSRDSSDMVLLDDNFASIVKGTKQGRIIFDNLKKSIKFLLSANVDTTIVVMFSLLIGLPLPFLPLPILWMNLVTDSLPALALSVEPGEKDVMKKKPKKGSLLEGIWKWILISGFFGFLSSFIVFYFSLQFYGLEIARTMAISTAIIFALFFVFVCKSDKSLLKNPSLFFNNKWVIYAFLTSFVLQLLAIYTKLGVLFDFIPLTFSQFSIVLLASFIGPFILELSKIRKLT